MAGSPHRCPPPSPPLGGPAVLQLRGDGGGGVAAHRVVQEGRQDQLEADVHPRDDPHDVRQGGPAGGTVLDIRRPSGMCGKRVSWCASIAEEKKSEYHTSSSYKRIEDSRGEPCSSVDLVN